MAILGWRYTPVTMPAPVSVRSPRPLGIAVSTVLMYGFAIAALFALNLRIPHPAYTIAFSAAMTVFAFFVLYRFWLGSNVARWLVMVDCLIQFLNLWNEHRWHVLHPDLPLSPLRLPLILCKVTLAVFLLVYLNTPAVRAWFTDTSRDVPDTPAPHSPPAASVAPPHTAP